MPRRFDTAYRCKRGDNLGDPEWHNRRWEDADLRIAVVEEGEGRRQAVADGMVQLVLSRVNDTILPVYADLLEIVAQVQSGAFMIAHSASPITLAVGQSRTFEIHDTSERIAFKPTAFLALTREATADDWAILQLTSWDSETGALTGTVIGRWGAAGPHDDWVIAAMAGPTVAQYSLVSDALQARADALAAKAAAEAAASGTAGSVSAAATHATAAAGSQSAAATAAASAQAALASISNKEDKANKGVANGYASLGSGGKVPAGQLDLSGVDASIAALDTAIGQRGRLVGEAVSYYGASAPSGYVFAAGQALSRTTYAALFAVLGTTFGAGDGSTTFNVPDARGRAQIGKDNMGGSSASRVTSGTSGIAGNTLGATGGDQRMQGHTHSVGGIDTNGASLGRFRRGGDTGDLFSITSGSAGSGNSQNMPPSIVCNVLIFTGVFT